jgi:hypothetical protein
MSVFLSFQAFQLLKDIDILVKKVQKISKMRQEVTSLKKAVDDVVKFLQSNKSLISYWFSKVSVICTIHKLNKPPKMHLSTKICPL